MVSMPFDIKNRDVGEYVCVDYLLLNVTLPMMLLRRVKPEKCFLKVDSSTMYIVRMILSGSR